MNSNLEAREISRWFPTLAVATQMINNDAMKKCYKRTGYTNKKSINQSIDSDRLKKNRIKNCINNNNNNKKFRETQKK